MVIIIRLLLSQFPDRIYILFRGDSGFFVGGLIDFLDDLDHDYLNKAKFKGMKSLLETKQWTKIKEKHDWYITKFTHQCMTWSLPRKFVVVRKDKETNPNDDSIHRFHSTHARINFARLGCDRF